MIRIWIGGSARSPFRIAQLAQRLAQKGIRPASITAQAVYLVDAEAWAPSDEARLAALVGCPLAPLEAISDDARLVIPRFGTVSPWSSKATEILRLCGLACVRRIEHGVLWRFSGVSAEAVDQAARLAMDRMTETFVRTPKEAERLFDAPPPKALAHVPVIEEGRAALERANREMGLALSAEEIDYLFDWFTRARRNPTDAELMMFAQANSEHCRHKIFRSRWIVDGHPEPTTLFAMIQATHAEAPDKTLVAYADNAAVFEGFPARIWQPDEGRRWRAREGTLHILAKVETHNHPTAISPHPGAATGAGGEIRDEGATGIGGKPKAGLVGFTTSHLRIPGFIQPWEEAHDPGRPGRIASALEIMRDGPIGAARFNNEFGRPNIAGYFRTLELEAGGKLRGYHKPVMLAGGVGAIEDVHVHKRTPPAGAYVVQLGGPALRIGLGGGAASSMDAGANEEELDFNSVQRDNPEMQRRCQEVLDACRALGPDNPILFIHDVGAGGLSNAIPELCKDTSKGAAIDLARAPSLDPSLSPMELWCNEAQERYVLAIAPERMETFAAICARERCPYAVLGRLDDSGRLVVDDSRLGVRAVDVPLSWLFDLPLDLVREAQRGKPCADGFAPKISVAEAARRVLRFPAVADKTFLVTIADRSVGGLVARDPMVGRWQVPVADCGVTTTDYDGYTGEAIAIGERPAVALLDPAASARIAIAEAVLNVLAADVAEPSDIKLSANWMAAAGDPQEDAALFDAVRAASRFCQALGLAIPVGKDSLSMRTVWDDAGQRKEQTAPVTLVVSAFARVQDVRRTLTPELAPEGELWFVELSARPHALGASALVQSFGRVGDTPPDASAELIARWMRAWRKIREHTTAYHDRSDGGLLTTLAEMGFASRIGIEIAVPDGEDALGFLFSEGPGVVWQAPRSARESIQQALAEHGLDARARVLGQTKPHRKLVIRQGSRTLLDEDLLALRRVWGETSARMQALRDHPRCAEEALDAACDPEDPGLFARLSFDEAENVAAPYIGGAKPKVAILREQGVNGHAEMAAAFARAGFEAVDVHMTDLIEGRASLDGFSGLAACGGFSYGDVLGAGRGWAATIQYHERLREQFARFFARPDTFALGVCNGCQMLAALNAMIPGAEHWPRFTRNESEQFEARLVLVEIVDSPSIFFAGMEGSILPVIVAHGEGRAVFPDAPEKAQPCLRYVGPGAQPAHRYPYNPNGSPGGWTGFTTPDGRITIMMPHPERLFRRVQFSWRPKAWRRSPWLRMFENARRWVAES